MTMREEVENERIENRVEEYVSRLPGTLIPEDGFPKRVMDAIHEIYRDGLKDGIEWDRPREYVPREEVTEGWYFAMSTEASEPRREAIEVKREPDGRLIVYRTGWDVDEPLDWYTDFLRVPAWCVEGIGQ